MDEDKMKRTLDYAGRADKAMERDWLSAYFLFFLGNYLQEDIVRMVSLPGESWVFEQRQLYVFSELQWCLTGLESDESTYTKMQKNTPLVKDDDTANVVEALHTTTHEWLKERKDAVEIIYFDYGASWSQAIEADIRLLAQKDLCNLFICTIHLNHSRQECVDRVNSMITPAEPVLAWKGVLSNDGSNEDQFTVKGLPDKILDIFYLYSSPMEMIGGFINDRMIDSADSHTQTEMTMVFLKKGLQKKSV